MKTAQPGDQIQVHYMIRTQNGCVATSQGKAPLEVTVGQDHTRLPGLGMALVGLSPGMTTTVNVTSDDAFGAVDPARVQRWSRQRFPKNATLRAGKLVRFRDEQGRRRLVRILEVNDNAIVVDSNHRWAGQSLRLEVEVVKIHAPDGWESPARPGRHNPDTDRTRGRREDEGGKV